MKQGWQIKKLGSLCSFERGLTYSKGDEADFSTKGVLRSNNVDLASNTLNFDEIKYLKEEIEIPDTKKVRRNSILMCMSNGSKAHLGKVAIIEDDIDFAFGGFMGLLVPDEGIVFPRYFYYALITPIYKSFIKGLSDGANINNLKFADLKEFEVPVPSISKQQCIVNLLDAEFAKIDTLKANAERNLQNAKDLFQAALKKELEPKEGWEMKKVDDVSVLITKGASPKWQGIEYVKDGGILFITSENVREGYLLLSPMKYVESKFNQKQKRSVLKKNDVLVNIVGASIGRAAVFDMEIEDANINQAVALVRCKQDEVLPRYLCLFLNSSKANDLYGLMKKDTARANLSLENISDITLPVPSLEDQYRLIDLLDDLDEKCKTLQANYEKTLSLCDDLKQALLRKAFNGEI